MALYPIFLKLEGVKVLIVGGGAVAEQKIEAVLRSATDVTVIAPKVTPRIARWAEQGLVLHVADEYRTGMATGYFLVISCADSESVNRAVYQEAKTAGAVVSRGEFQIAISTGGNSPLLSQNVRKELEEQFGPEYGPWTAWLGRMRSDLRSLLPPTQRRKELLHLLTLLKPQGASKVSTGTTRR